MKRLLTMRMPDGTIWGVPVEMIARNRAIHYKEEFGGDIERSLKEDTLPLFEESDYEISDWAVNNMNWSDFDGYQSVVSTAKEYDDKDFQEAWLDADKDLID